MRESLHVKESRQEYNKHNNQNASQAKLHDYLRQFSFELVRDLHFLSAGGAITKLVFVPVFKRPAQQDMATNAQCGQRVHQDKKDHIGEV